MGTVKTLDTCPLVRGSVVCRSGVGQVRPLRFLSLQECPLDLREEVRAQARPLADESGYELVDVELAAMGREGIVRVLLDKPGGITVGDCAAFSRRLGDCLEMNQTIPGGYRLEVSSPGIERPLRSAEAANRFAGQRAAIALHSPRGD